MAKVNVYQVTGAEDTELRIYSKSSDPNERFLAALELKYAPKLLDDESWLVRHAAKRTLHRNELEMQRLFFSSPQNRYPFMGISDIAYELYKATWINKNTTPRSRIEDVQNWAHFMLHAHKNNHLPDTYEDWVYNGVLSDTSYLSLDRFLGWMEPDGVGLYQNRVFVAKLLDYDPEFLAAYDADINDGYMRQHSVDEVLGDAHKRCNDNSVIQGAFFRGGPEK